jgi:Recombination endonuclease VII
MPYVDAEKRRTARRLSYLHRKDKILAQEREYRANNPEAYRKTKLKHRYGLTFEAHQEMFEAQGGKCALCGERTAADVDHDHNTGKVRGLLCRACNLGLGMFKDSVDGLERAIAYLKNTRV